MNGLRWRVFLIVRDRFVILVFQIIIVEEWLMTILLSLMNAAVSIMFDKQDDTNARGQGNGSDLLRQIVRPGKGLVAIGARVWSLLGMSPHVSRS